MKAEIVERKGCRVRVKIEIPADVFAEAVDRAFRKLVKNAQVPGFRKGRVPRSVFEAIYGKKTLYDEAIQEVAPPAYEDALRDLRLEPIVRPRISFSQVEDGKPLVFNVDLVLKPEVKLGNYKDIDVVKEEIEVNDDMVNEVLKEYQEKSATFEDVKDRGAKEGDLLLIEIKDERSEEWRKMQVVMKDEFEETLRGAKAGDEREAEFKGEKFRIRVLDIKEKKLPSIDDNFAATFGYSSLEEWKNAIRNALEEELSKRAERIFREKVIEKLLELSEVEIPEEAIAEEIEYLKESDARKAKEYGLSLEDFLSRMGLEGNKIEEYYRRRAERRLKTEFVLDALAKKEDISLSEQEFDEELKKIAEENRIPYEKVKAVWGKGERAKVLKDDIIKRKAIDRIVEYVSGRGEEKENADSGSS
ncbi:MAG: trigger factor [Synergistetes bacterium]|nr:trigger factor [Synergistota bacterium]